ncbi:MAG: hypothetical protein PHE61_01575 [Candidatus Omnitrophica bacterium]|nr:hypothetical protein [Candidatus Omnitrophota bacterium]
MKKKDRFNKDDLLFEIAFYEKLLREKEDFTDVLIPLADAYTRAGLYKKGLEIDKRLSCLRPDDETVYYNLACSYSLLGMIEETLSAIERSFQLGYRDLNHLEKDSDLNNAKKDARFRALMARYFGTKT